MAQTSHEQSRQADSKNEKHKNVATCNFTEVELIRQKNRKRHIQALCEFFKPINKEFKVYVYRKTVPNK